MPPYPRPVSQAQRGLAHAAASDPAVAKKTGFSQAAAREFVKGDKPGKLPEHKAPKRKKISRLPTSGY